jgi:hypothetical protein
MQRLTKAVTALLAVAALAAPAAAQADSIAYVKDGDVWLTTPDGGRQYQVTSTGGYSDVSQADDGTMIALNGIRLHKLARDGAVLADFDTPVSDTRPPGSRTFWGPYDPAISPDGQKVGYTYYYVGVGQSPGCYPPTCYTVDTQGGTAYTWSDRQTPWDEPLLGTHSGWRNPSWMDNENVMLSDPTRLPNRDVVFDRIGSRGVLQDWFRDRTQGNTHVSGGDMTRARDKLAFAVGENDNGIRVYWIERWPTAFPPRIDEEYPLTCFQYGTATRVSTPTWSPDGGGLAWSDGDGLRTVAVPAFPAGCDPSRAQQTSTLIVPGATQPDWGPADVPAPRPPRPDPRTEPRPDPRTDPRTDLGDRDPRGRDPRTRDPRGRAANPLGAKALRATRAGGVTVRLSAPAAGRLTATAHLKGRKVGAGSKRIGRKGAATVAVRFTAAGKRALKRGGTVTVKLAFKPARGAVKRATITAKVTR